MFEHCSTPINRSLLATASTSSLVYGGREQDSPAAKEMTTISDAYDAVTTVLAKESGAASSGCSFTPAPKVP